MTVPGAPVPALLKRTSSRPNFSFVFAKRLATDFGSAYIRCDGKCIPADFLDDGFQSVNAAPRQHYYVTGIGERDGTSLTYARTRTPNQTTFIFSMLSNCHEFFRRLCHIGGGEALLIDI